jgi:hypothetical protein
MIAVEEKHHLKRKFWLIFDDLKELDPVIYCFLTSMEWLNYESWESYGTALSFNLETVCEQFEKHWNFMTFPFLYDRQRIFRK